MKNRNNVYTITLVALAFAFAPVLEAGSTRVGLIAVGTSGAATSPNPTVVLLTCLPLRAVTVRTSR